MDLQERKIHFVQEFLKLKNEEIIHKLEDTLKTEKIKLIADPAVPYTIEEFNKIIERAEDDQKNGRVRTSDELKEDIKSWG
jgi:hypothetical protein